MVKIDGTRIAMTRGDTLRLLIEIVDQDGEIYIPSQGDKIRFACKKVYTDDEVLIVKDIPIETMELHLEPNDTKVLEMGKSYVYDIQLTKVNGDIDTFITKSVLTIDLEVD